MGPTVAAPVAKPKALACPNCGGPVELRGFAHTLSVVCPQCLTVLDATNPQLQILQTFQGQQRYQPLIPLGTRGTLAGVPWEAIGYQIREVRSEEGTFGWSEYLLFNPYKGFRYLSEYQGHWNFIRVLAALPDHQRPNRPLFQGCVYRLFDRSTAITTYVLGEFPWQARVGDQAQVEDFVAAPYMLSSEATAEEVTWSQGEYMTGPQIWAAFRLPGSPQRPSGVFSNQPSPFVQGVGSAWRLCLLLMAALVALVILFSATSARSEVFRQKYSYAPGGDSEPSFVTSDFQLTGRPSNLEIRINTNLQSDWAYFNFALVNQDTEKARDFGREVSYYGDEGSPRDRVILAAVPAGKYYLRVEPEKEARSAPVNYEIVIRRDVPTYGWFWVAALLLLLPPIFMSIRRARFETARWNESNFKA